MNIGIIGIGCIGSSLARDIKTRGLGTLSIFDNNPDFLETSRLLNLGDNYVPSPADIAKTCDIIFICTPVKTIAPIILEQLLPHLCPHTILTDVGSVKENIVTALDGKLPKTIDFIGGHPITSGTTGTGPESGRQGVFTNQPYILTPTPQTSVEALKTLENIVLSLGAKPVQLSPDKHDSIFAFTSHLPHILAFSTVMSANRLHQNGGINPTDFAGGSYKDITRVASSDSRLWTDIFLSNKTHILKALDDFLIDVNALRMMIENNATVDLQQELDRLSLIKRQTERNK